MRSQAHLLRHARAALLDAPKNASRAYLASRRPRKPTRAQRALPVPSSDNAVELEGSRALVSLQQSSPPDAPGPSDASEPEAPAASPEDEPEKPKARRARTTTREPPPPTLPSGLDVLWSPATDGSAAEPSALPPPDIFADALTSLRIALHPQTQHRAAYVSASSGTTQEPAIALYCPFEGGDYIVDETVRELARKMDADVVVVDAAQLAAGEWGMFGKGASVFEFSQNPLHFPSSSTTAARQSARSAREEEEDEDEEDEEDESPASAILHLVASPMRPGRSSSGPSKTSPTTKPKVFFDELLNLPSADGKSSRNPRLIYVRDVPTLAPASAEWYPALLAALRSRRQGPMGRVVHFPTALVLGCGPPLVGAPEPLGSGGMGGAMNVLVSARGPSGPSSGSLARGTGSGTGTGTSGPNNSLRGWGEDDVSETARERRLRERLRRWERGGTTALADELPRLETIAEPEARESGPRGLVVVNGTPVGPIGGSFGGSGLPGPLAHLLGALAGRSTPRIPGGDAESNAGFFRTAVLLPAERSQSKEQECRMARRREINELTMRMGLGAIGGVLGALEPPAATEEKPDTEPISAEEDVSEPTAEAEESLAEDVSTTAADSSESPAEVTSAAEDKPSAESEPAAPQADEAPAVDESQRMWDDWGKRLETWSTVRQIADRALGVALARPAPLPKAGLRMEPTSVTWADVHGAWTARRAARDVRRKWLQSASVRGEHDDEDAEGVLAEDEEKTDEIVERVKNDPDLDAHEQRLLGCIVNSASMPTSFEQVHLPATTIDAVRTVVSLPLLHPEAFQTGVLKEHGMTGVLLFGPPGTGKTLMARALAKEAGCRMMVISPSDVMDMYVGEGEKLVKSVFTLARRLAPCVVFIDEIDALFGARASGRESGGALAHRGVLTEFMQEMDGLRSKSTDNVIVIGATNRPFDLDDAVLRRLPRRLLIDLPGELEREAILKIMLRDEKLASDVDLNGVAKRTESFSGSDLKHLCVSAALDAVKERVDVPWLNTTKTENASSSTNVAPAAVSSDATTVSPANAPSEAASTKPSAPATESSPSHSSLVEDAAAEAARGGEPADAASTPGVRMLGAHNFTRALREITPSASEALGSLADLRKWNDEFGEGRKDKRRVQVWGKGTFGFALSPPGEPIVGGVGGGPSPTPTAAPADAPGASEHSAYGPR